MHLELRPPTAIPLLSGLARSGAAAGRRQARPLHVTAAVVAPGSTVLVAGATGGVGQLLTAKLLERGYKVKAMGRSREKVAQLLGAAEGLEVVYGDMRDPATLAAALAGVDAVACCTGTTAFPSARWKDGNNPEQTDRVGISNLVAAAAQAPRALKRFVLTTSAGVERYGQLPFSILNLFGVLKFKRMGEQALEASGVPYTIIRPGRLTDGPYTSSDLNSLLKGISGLRQDVQLSARDDLNGEASRIAVAEAIVQSLGLEAAEGRAIAISSTEGAGPGQDGAKWRALFEGAV